MIDISTEEVITLAEAARSLPRRRAGRPVHLSCVYRWTTVGCRGVVLEHIQIGSTRCTSREALQRFFDQLTPAPEEAPAKSKSRRRAIEAAERRLARSGI